MEIQEESELIDGKKFVAVGSRQIHDFKKQPELRGILADKIQSQFKGNDFVLLVNKKEVLVYGKTTLQSKLDQVELKKEVIIKYLGEKKSENTKRTYEDFEVLAEE